MAITFHDRKEEPFLALVVNIKLTEQAPSDVPTLTVSQAQYFLVVHDLWS